MKNSRFFSKPLVLCSVLLMAALVWSCGNGPANESSAQPDAKEEKTTGQSEPTNESSQPAPMTTLKTDEQVFAWVDRLNIRSAPNTGGKLVANVTEQEALSFTGEKSDGTETIVLRGVAYDEPWLKVRTKDGKEGWVFGGAVKRQGETKGNDPVTDDRFFFPRFGRFDLSAWQNSDSSDESGGDAEIDVSTYTKDGQMLEISRSDAGEYGYSRTFKLMKNDGKLLKTRHFEFVADGTNELRETVNDFTANPPKKYSRSQKLDKHYMQLNERPVMANGAWTEGPADALD